MRAERTDVPQWIRTAQVLARLQQWEALLVVYYKQWHRYPATTGHLADQYHLFSSTAYWEWYEEHETRHDEIEEETRPRRGA